jgi:hypothetical protein
MPNTMKTNENLSISFPDSLMSWLQWDQHRFQVELDELYRFHYLLSPTDPLLPLKNAKYRENQWKSQYFLSGFVHELTPMRPSLAPSRIWRALSIPLFTFPNRPSLAPQKCQILLKYAEKKTPIWEIPSRVRSSAGPNVADDRSR